MAMAGGSNVISLITTTATFGLPLCESTGRPALAYDGNPTAAISAAAVNRTCVADSRRCLRCIGSSPPFTRLPTSGLLRALDGRLHLLCVLQLTFEQRHRALES